MIVDFHIHVLEPAAIPLALRRHLAHQAAHRREPLRDLEWVLPRVGVGFADPNGGQTLIEMDRAGVDCAVIPSVDWEIACGPAEVSFPSLLERYRDVKQRSGGRIVPFAGGDPRRPGVLDLVDRALGEWGFSGLKLYPPAGFYPHDPLCIPIYERCLEAGVPLVLHTAPIGGPLRPRFAQPVHVGDVQSAYPELSIVLAHSGHRAWWREAVDIAREHPHTYLELSQWSDDALHDPGGFVADLAVMRDAVGAGRILFGSDFMFGPSTRGERSPWPRWIDVFASLPETARRHGRAFSREEADLILGGNAQRLLRLADR